MRNTLIAMSIAVTLLIPQPAAAFSLKTPFVKVAHVTKVAAKKVGTTVGIILLTGLGIYVCSQGACGSN